MISDWVAAISVGVVVLLGFCLIWVLKYATQLRLDKLPRLAISNPIEITSSFSPSGKCIRMFSLEIKNISSTVLKAVQVKKQSFINRFGDQADVLGERFRHNIEAAQDMTKFEHSLSFDIAPNDVERVDIALMDEVNDPERILMTYAQKPNAILKNSITKDCFPTDLIVRVTADNLSNPVNKPFKIFVDELGILRMKSV